MTKSEKLYHDIAASIPDATESKMFGALCLKAPNGKAGVMFWKDDMIFKLDKDNEEVALKLKGAKIFEPAAGKKMGGWIHVPNKHADKWTDLAKKTMDIVRKIKK
jgi:hypothetical protein